MTRTEHVVMVITLKIKNMWVMPQGTAQSVKHPLQCTSRLTVSEVFQVDQLVVPLCDNSDCIFDECDHDQESSDSREVSVLHQISQSVS